MSIEQTLAERGNRYGDFTDHARLCQELKSLMQTFAPARWTTSAPWNHLSDVQKQALEVIADKIARILSGDPNYADNWHDIQGYAKLVEDRLHKAPITFKERCAEIDAEFQAAALAQTVDIYAQAAAHIAETSPQPRVVGMNSNLAAPYNATTPVEAAVQPEVAEDPFTGAPDWAKYKAQDRDGEWWFHSHKPVESVGCMWGLTVVGGKNSPAPGGDGPNPNWRETLIERPTK